MTTMFERLRAARGEKGFTLIETVAALTVFSLVTLGLVPLFATSLRGSALSRSYTVGKNVAVESMERIRGLPFFTSYASKNKRVDLLDLYYPNLGAGYAANTFTTTCTVSTINPACPPNIPDNVTVVYKATFVRTSTYSATPVRYDVVTPPAGYRWDSATGADVPPSQLMEVLVRTSWNVGTQTKTYELKTLVGDRAIGSTRLRGTARIDYGVQVLTSFQVGGLKSDLTFTGATGESKVETKLLSNASQTASAGTIRLVRASDDPNVLGTDIGASPLTAASSSIHAPPDTTPAGATAADKVLTHPEWGSRTVAFIDGSNTAALKAQVANELPTAAGEGKTTTSGSGMTARIHNQAETGANTYLKLETGENMFEVNRTTRALQANTSATTTATTAADRKVETSASAQLGDVQMLPATFVSGSADAVIGVRDFRGTVTCKATANVGTATATASWTATFRYWEDPTNDGSDNGKYTTLSLNSATVGATLETIQTQNPLVHDGATAAEDIYMFVTPTTPRGFLKDWTATTPTTSVSADGRVVNANMDGAIRIDTAPLDPAIPTSSLSVSLGKLNCEAMDNR